MNRIKKASEVYASGRLVRSLFYGMMKLLLRLAGECKVNVVDLGTHYAVFDFNVIKTHIFAVVRFEYFVKRLLPAADRRCCKRVELRLFASGDVVLRECYSCRIDVYFQSAEIKYYIYFIVIVLAERPAAADLTRWRLRFPDKAR